MSGTPQSARRLWAIRFIVSPERWARPYLARISHVSRPKGGLATAATRVRTVGAPRASCSLPCHPPATPLPSPAAPLPHPCRSPRQSSVTAIGRRKPPDAMKRGCDARLSTVGSKLGATDAPSPPTAPLAAPSAAPLRNGERCLQLEQAAGSGPVQQNGHDAVPNAAEAGAQAGARVHRRERFAGHEPGPYVDDGRSFVAPCCRWPRTKREA